MRDVVDHMEMPLWEHLEVLRWTLIRILIAWAIGVLTSFMFIPSLFNQVVLAPSREDFFLYRFLAKLNSYTSLVPDFWRSLSRWRLSTSSWHPSFSFTCLCLSGHPC